MIDGHPVELAVDLALGFKIAATDLAEAMACTRHHRHAALKEFDTRPGAELSRRWTRNVMLNKWLEYCVDKGHRFFPSSEDIAIS